MPKKFLRYIRNEGLDLKELWPHIDYWVENHRGDEICGITVEYQIGRKVQPAAVFSEGFEELYMTSDCLRQLADKLDSLGGNNEQKSN